MTRRVPLVAAALGLALLPAAVTPVLGHVGLVSSDPAAGTTVSDVRTVTLVFSEPLKKGVSSFKLVGPDGMAIGTGTATAPRRMTLDALELKPGEYTVRWAAAGDDGHLERGRFTFTVEMPAVTVPPATPSSSPSSGSSNGPAATAPPTGTPVAIPAAITPSPAASPSPDATTLSASGTDVLIPIVAGLAIVGVVGALVLRRSRTA
jgi:methionine-rich copper-binding protein CopC